MSVIGSAHAPHTLDEDAVCIHCGFDGAEWWHLERQKEKADREPEPPCTHRSDEKETRP